MKGAHEIIIGAGDAHKELDTLAHVWMELSTHGASRHSLMVNLGGGMVTDLGGFAASTFKRGIPYINVPTTLLAMVDASTGGKTGFDYACVKNEIGSFYSPLDTYIEPSWLDTLPTAEFLSGYAEMVKHALVADKEEYTRLLGADLSDDIERKILTSIRIKRQVIESDPYEKGLRKILNFGFLKGGKYIC
jgi:3-dehydroquinate synthase